MGRTWRIWGTELSYSHVLLKIRPTAFLAVTNSLNWYLFSRRDCLVWCSLCLRHLGT